MEAPARTRLGAIAFVGRRSLADAIAMRICCVIATLGAGGAEHVLTTLANQLADDGHDVSLITLEPPGSTPFYPLSEGVRVTRLGLLGDGGALRAWRMLERLRSLRRQLRVAHPDVVVSFMDTVNVYTLLATRGQRVPVIVSERIDPAQHEIGWLRQLARSITYPLATHIVVQTEAIRAYFGGALRERTVVIPNPVERPAHLAQPERPDADGMFHIVSAGRLTHQKAHERLIAAFAQVAAEFPAWRLRIFGEGPLRPALERQVAELGLIDRVQLPGIRQDIAQELAASHVFVLPSRYEGFPNALAEALACGLPAIAYAGVSGTRELIEPGHSGLLIDDARPEAALAEALRGLMADPQRRAEIGRHAAAVADRYAPERVFAQWGRLLEQAAK